MTQPHTWVNHLHASYLPLPLLALWFAYPGDCGELFGQRGEACCGSMASQAIIGMWKFAAQKHQETSLDISLCRCVLLRGCNHHHQKCFFSFAKGYLLLPRSRYQPTSTMPSVSPPKMPAPSPEWTFCELLTNPLPRPLPMVNRQQTVWHSVERCRKIWMRCALVCICCTDLQWNWTRTTTPSPKANFDVNIQVFFVRFLFQFA